MSLPLNPDEVLSQAEHHHKEYIKYMRLLHEAAAARASRDPAHSSLVVVKGSPFAGSDVRRRGSAESRSAPRPFPPSGEQRPLHAEHGQQLGGGAPDAEQLPALTRLGSGGADRARDDAPDHPLALAAPARTFTMRTVADRCLSYTTDPLPEEHFSEHDLSCHLASLDGAPQTTVTALGDLWHQRNEGASSILESFDDVEEAYESAVYEVYEVTKDSVPDPLHHNNGTTEGEILEASTVWDTLKDVNSDGDAVGRMTILQEPSPLMLGLVHKTMGKHFDVDELFSHLVSTNGNRGKTRAYMNRAYETDRLRQRSFFFVFKYYTVVGEGLTPAPWQAFDSRPPDRRSPDHIDIAEASAVLALSLGGKPIKNVRQRVRRRGVEVRQGDLYDPFAPWHMLSIQCYPDNLHSMRSEESQKPIISGPFAFLDTLSLEYADAVKRYIGLNQMITKLITPPNQFMFDSRLRDKLLFEDKAFTYSRRYFWAYNTLGVINDGIKSMRAAYLDTFTPEFWEGRHETLWPLDDPSSDGNREYLQRMQVLRQELEGSVTKLQGVWEKNEHTRDEIRSLREQLFSGSSVKESRRAIEQGDNIKILTSVSMIFLPLTFVTSIFGITTLDYLQLDKWQFPAIMVAVCVPFFLLILILHVQTLAAVSAMRKSIAALKGYFRRIFLPSAATGAAQSAPGGGERRTRFRRRDKQGIKRTQSGLQQQHQNQATKAGRRAWRRIGSWRPWRGRTPGSGGGAGIKDTIV